MTKAPLSEKRTGPHRADRGRKGMKRRVRTEEQMRGWAIEETNHQAGKLACATLESVPVRRPEPTEEAPQG